MRYKVYLKQNEEGYAVWCPGLPGCWSQGNSEEEAIQNIRQAIEEYLQVSYSLGAGEESREVEVSFSGA